MEKCRQPVLWCTSRSRLSESGGLLASWGWIVSSASRWRTCLAASILQHSNLCTSVAQRGWQRLTMWYHQWQSGQILLQRNVNNKNLGYNVSSTKQYSGRLKVRRFWKQFRGNKKPKSKKKKKKTDLLIIGSLWLTNNIDTTVWHMPVR